ncbi:hypothetical protein [Bradyrhizobium sp. USDA 10063]
MIDAKGAPDKAAYIGHQLETQQREVARPWVPELRISAHVREILGC